MFVSQRFIDTRTGEIVTSVLLTQIQHFEEYNGPLQGGDFDTRLAQHMSATYRCKDCGTEAIEEAEGQTCRTCGRGIIGRVSA